MYSPLILLLNTQSCSTFSDSGQQKRQEDLGETTVPVAWKRVASAMLSQVLSGDSSGNFCMEMLNRPTGGGRGEDNFTDPHCG